MEGFDVARSTRRIAAPAAVRMPALVRDALAFARHALALVAQALHVPAAAPFFVAPRVLAPLLLAPLVFAAAPRAEAGDRVPGAEAPRGSSGALAALEQFVAGLDPLLKDAAAPVLATLIEDSREQAVAQGVEAIPASIRAEIEDYVPAEILDRVRWCVSCGGPFTLQHNTFLIGYAPAITLDYVVVFQRRDDALGDPSLWVHELKHVMQYGEWGVAGFAARYVDDYEAVESEAAEYRWQWMKKTRYLERRRAKAGRS